MELRGPPSAEQLAESRAFLARHNATLVDDPAAACFKPPEALCHLYHLACAKHGNKHFITMRYLLRALIVTFELPAHDPMMRVALGRMLGVELKQFVDHYGTMHIETITTCLAVGLAIRMVRENDEDRGEYLPLWESALDHAPKLVAQVGQHRNDPFLLISFYLLTHRAASVPRGHRGVDGCIRLH